MENTVYICIQFLCNNARADLQQKTFLTPETSIFGKTIEGYLNPISSLTSNTIITKLNTHAVHNSRYLQSKLMFKLCPGSMVKI